MSASQRRAARERAYERGMEARKAGLPASSNPYKPLGNSRHPGGPRVGEWSLRPAWASGWNAADSERDDG